MTRHGRKDEDRSGDEDRITIQRREILLTKDADLILGKARKLSMGWAVPGPALCEELIFQAFMALKHPLYQALSARFSLSATVLTNMLCTSLVHSRKDEPTQANRSREAALFRLMADEAARQQRQLVNEQDVMAALFLQQATDNAVMSWFQQHGMAADAVLACIRQYRSSDWIREEEAGIREQTRTALRESAVSTHRALAADPGQVLAAYGHNLTQQARDGKLNPIYGREAEITAIQEVLSRMHQNNPILIGPPGVGKTSIVEGLAHRIAQGRVPRQLKDKELWQVSIGALIAGTTLRGQFEERIKALMQACEQDPKIMVYFQGIHQLVGAGDLPGGSDAASLLKPALTRGEIRCIGTTTVDAYYRYIEKDASLAHGFEVVRVAELPVAETRHLLEQLKGRYERFHHVTILPEAIEAAVEFSDRYLRDRVLPGKALGLLDQACAKIQMQAEDARVVNRQVVAEVVSAVAQVPLSQILFAREEIFQKLEENLKKRVIGQDHALRRIADVVQLTKYEMALNARRPDGVFMCAGPTGVGKTELAKALAESLLGSEAKLLRFDMSEYAESHSVAKLIGAPPGYIGHDEGGQLTGAVKASPYCVILFDEIEKAHPQLQRIFLQIFDDGRLTDSRGTTVSFSESTIILTTNLGVRNIDMEACRGLAPAERYAYIRSVMEPAIKQFFSPEFMNRLDDVLYFMPLTPEVIERITRQKVGKVLERFTAKGVAIEIDPGVYAWVSERGTSFEYGARHLNRTIEEQLLMPLTRALLDQPQAKRFVLSRAGDTLAIA